MTDRGRGYVEGMTMPLREPDGEPASVTTGEALADVLAAQHQDLQDAWNKVPQLHDGAREDVFLHARRRLAVHVALEQVLLAPRLDDVEVGIDLDLERQQAELDRAVLHAEGRSETSEEFVAACAAVAAAFEHHTAAQERMVLTGVLPEPDREVVDTALALWDGSGDAYLGNTWSEMRATSIEQLSRD